MQSPVIFLGMHRSGTSMVGRFLEDLGLFVGRDKDENNEAIFFQDLNDWLLSQSGARWDEPTPLRKYFWRNDEVVDWSERYLRNLLASPRSARFTGYSQYAKGGIKTLDRPWGWKDPRNTFTLPIWLRIFPNAKLIYIERNGVDVAQSLKAREDLILADAERFYRKWRLLFFIRTRKSGFASSPRCLDLADAFSLWAEYIREAESVLRSVPRAQVLRLRYEQVLIDPVTALSEAASFCGLSVDNNRIAQVAKQALQQRSSAYQSSPALRAFALEHRDELRAAGYEP